MRERHDHRILDLVKGHVHALMAQDGTVERAIVDDNRVGCVDHSLQALTPVGVALRQVPHVGGLIVYCDRYKQHLRLLGVAMRAVLNRHGAVCLKVKPKCSHADTSSILVSRALVYQQRRSNPHHARLARIEVCPPKKGGYGRTHQYYTVRVDPCQEPFCRSLIWLPSSAGGRFVA